MHYKLLQLLDEDSFLLFIEKTLLSQKCKSHLEEKQWTSVLLIDINCLD